MVSAKQKRLLKYKTDPSKRHVRLHRWMTDTPAWRSLDPAARAVLIEIYGLYNGSNNGIVHLSVREAARRVHINKDTAARCLRALQDRGFIRRRAHEPDDFNLRNARCWILTEFEFCGRVATKDFMRWQPPEKSDGRPTSGDGVTQPEGQIRHH